MVVSAVTESSLLGIIVRIACEHGSFVIDLRCMANIVEDTIA